VSSTIRDLEDLRGALRFWLESAGYDVQLSEYNDFDRRPEADTFETCFANVASSDYYILIVGRERGSWYKQDERITVTRQEFRVANQAARTRSLGILVFVREEVAAALKQWQDDGCPPSESSVLADPAFTDEFLGEVKKLDEGSLASRWIYGFRDFRDIIDALRVLLGLPTDIERRLLQANLLNEILINLSLVATKTKRGTIFPDHWWVGSVREGIIMPHLDLDRPIGLTAEQIARLGLITLYRPERLRREAVTEALKRGLYLQIDPQTGEVEPTEAHKALQALEDDIVSLVSLRKSELANEARLEFLMLARRANTGQLGTRTLVDTGKLTLILLLHDRMEDVFNGLAQFARWILGVADSPTIARRPPSPVVSISEQIEAERVTVDHLTQALTEGVRPFGEKLTPEMQDLAVEAIVKQLRARIPLDVMPDEALAEFVREKLEDLIVPPSTGHCDDASIEGAGSHDGIS